MKKICVARNINGVCINGLEYLLDDNDKVMWFESIYTAKQFLKSKGVKESEHFIYLDKDNMHSKNLTKGFYGSISKRRYHDTKPAG